MVSGYNQYYAFVVLPLFGVINRAAQRLVYNLHEIMALFRKYNNDSLIFINEFIIVYCQTGSIIMTT